MKDYFLGEKMLPDLSYFETGIVFIGFTLVTITILITILDYANKGKHINRKRW
jgi:hypothetical protein